MIVSTSLMIGDMSLSVAKRSRSKTSSPCSVSLTSEMRKPDAASCSTRWVASAFAPQRHEEVAQHQVNRDFSEERVVNRRLAVGREQVNVRESVAASERERGANFGWRVAVAVRRVRAVAAVAVLSGVLRRRS